MKRKLTLSLERATIKRAKAYADKCGKPVSQIAGEYFDVLTQESSASATGRPGTGRPGRDRPGRDRPLSDEVQQLIGIAEGSEEDYYHRLEEKHR